MDTRAPDPVLIRVLDIPKACNRCQEDRSVDWAESHADDWYEEALAQRPTRALALAIDAAWNGELDAGPKLLVLAREQDNAIWQTMLVALRGFQLLAHLAARCQEQGLFRDGWRPK